uniref:Uncharacterized protein n=1 Tax=Plectus sambesii TaxID=2011161 RepID=A0A914X1B4_9BILA
MGQLCQSHRYHDNRYQRQEVLLGEQGRKRVNSNPGEAVDGAVGARGTVAIEEASLLIAHEDQWGTLQLGPLRVEQCGTNCPCSCLLKMFGCAMSPRPNSCRGGMLMPTCGKTQTIGLRPDDSSAALTT